MNIIEARSVNMSLRRIKGITLLTQRKVLKYFTSKAPRTDYQNFCLCPEKVCCLKYDKP